MSSLRRFGGGSLLKFSAQITSNWALFKDGRVAICSESLTCMYSPLRPEGSAVWTVTLCSGTQSSQIIFGKHKPTYQDESAVASIRQQGNHLKTAHENSPGQSHAG
jgi:hypothetical protein